MLYVVGVADGGFASAKVRASEISIGVRWRRAIFRWTLFLRLRLCLCLLCSVLSRASAVVLSSSPASARAIDGHAQIRSLLTIAAPATRESRRATLHPIKRARAGLPVLLTARSSSTHHVLVLQPSRLLLPRPHLAALPGQYPVRPPAPPAASLPLTATRSRSPQYLGRKTLPIKRADAEPLTREDIQYDLLYFIFADPTRCFIDYMAPGQPSVNFCDLYVNSLFNSNKCSKVLKEKMVETPEFAIEFAKMALLTNVGRINTTMACAYSATVASPPC